MTELAFLYQGVLEIDRLDPALPRVYLIDTNRIGPSGIVLDPKIVETPGFSSEITRFVTGQLLSLPKHYQLIFLIPENCVISSLAG